MKRYFVVIALLVATAVAQSAPSQPSTEGAPFGLAALTKSADPTTQKAEDMLAKMITKLGGQAYLNYTTREESGRTYSFYKGEPNSTGNLFWRYWRFPDQERVEFTKQRDVVYINNGDKGFEVTYKGTTTQDKKDLDDYLRRRKHSLENVLRHWLHDPKTVVLYLGPGVADRRMAEIISIISPENEEVTVYIDPITWLPIQKKFEWRDQDKYKNDETEIYGGYRAVQGIQTPFTLTRARNGDTTSQRFLNGVEYGKPLEDGMFQASITYDPAHYRKK